MITREGTQEDKSSIIKVLKASLGEDDLPLSQNIWNYKHTENPFGKSLTLVAEEEGEIIGVRAFMRWKWKLKDRTFECYRAVDTATHPDHQGKGIFKKLTLKAVDNAIEEQGDFIFNTPNEQSRPGYLKMGWKPAGKVKVGIIPRFNNLLDIRETLSSYEIIRNSCTNELDDLCNIWNRQLETSARIFTPKSSQYLIWRYETNPLQDYEIFCVKDIYIAGYIKSRGRIKELRISECIYNKDTITSDKIMKVIKGWSTKFGAQFITYSPDLIINKLISYQGNIGPILTLRKLNIAYSNFEYIINIDNWSPSLGDLELF